MPVYPKVHVHRPELPCQHGADTAAFQAAAESPAALVTRDRMTTSIAGRQMIIGVDRLDYSKGLEERFLGYERFLADDPDHCQEVFLFPRR